MTLIVRILLRSESAMISRCADRPLAAIRKSHVVAQLYEFADSTWLERLWGPIVRLQLRMDNLRSTPSNPH